MSRSKQSQRRWERIWRENPPEALPWEEGRPSPVLVDLVENNQVPIGAALDICCGTGSNAVYLAQHGFETSSMDISPTAVSHARKRAQETGLKLSLQSGDAAHLTYPDGSFNFIFDRGCFHHIPPDDRQDFVLGLYRVLRKGGRYQLLCFSGRTAAPPYGFTPEDIQSYFSPHFHILSLKETASREPDGVVRFFLSVLMEKKEKTEARE